MFWVSKIVQYLFGVKPGAECLQYPNLGHVLLFIGWYPCLGYVSKVREHGYLQYFIFSGPYLRQSDLCHLR